MGWYDDDRKITVNAVNFNPWETGPIDWSGSLVGIAEYNEPSTHPVLLKLGQTDDENYYLSFNRDVGMNSMTQEGGDQVLITKQFGSGGGSDLVAKLGSNTD